MARENHRFEEKKMKEAFREQKITPKRMEMIKIINRVLKEFEEQGYRLTLRQLYYQLVSQTIIENKIQEYAKLSQTLVISRMNGLTDWEMIEDRIRKPHLLYWVHDIGDAIKDTIRHYRLDRQLGQPNQIEIWTEKDAVSNILKRVTTLYHIRLMVNRGYSSCSAMYEAFNRMDGSNQTKIILYVGDHDPSGLDMLRDIDERLEEFGLSNFKIVPVALTKEQIQKYDPPPNPAKITDPRAGWYISKYGEESWELDALKPDVLEKIVDDAVLEYLDLSIYNKMVEKEAKDKARLRDIINKLI